MTPARTAEALTERYPDAVLHVVHFRDEVSAVVRRDRLVEVARACHDDLGYDFLSDLTAVDWLDRAPRFDVVYHLTSLSEWSRFRLRVQVDEHDTVPTVTEIWGAADWPEREVYDMFGIEFEGHPNLRRLLMPEGWIGHPLRKDFRQTQIALPRPRSDKVLE